MISLKVRSYRPYADFTLVVGNTEIHLGMLDIKEMQALQNDLSSALNEVSHMIEIVNG